MASERKKIEKAQIPTPIGDVPGVSVSWKYTHTDLVDQEVIIHDYVEIETQFGQALVCNCTVKDELQSVLMGAQVIMNQILKSSNYLPVSATIINTGKYYLLQ